MKSIYYRKIKVIFICVNILFFIQCTNSNTRDFKSATENNIDLNKKVTIDTFILEDPKTFEKNLQEVLTH